MSRYTRAMRITGGVLRSRALRAPKGTSTRPTSDRVREAIFSMLAADGVLAGEGPGPRVLDLYAGSGALAFEALSRGAREAVLVEEGRDALAAIRDNARSLGLSAAAQIVAGRLPRALDRLEGTFELAFADPPYALVREAAFAETLERIAARLAPGAVLVLEHAAEDEPSGGAALALDRRRRYGDSAVSLFRRERAGA